MAINCHPIFISCQSVYATQLIPHTKRLWHVAHRHRKIEKREDMRRYACGDLVCKDHKGSDGVNGKTQKGRHDSSDGCQRTSHFSTWASDLIASPVSLGTLKETRSAPGSVIREWTWLCDMALWLPACQRETGQAQDVERYRIMASELWYYMSWNLYKWAVWQWFYTIIQIVICIYNHMHWCEFQHDMFKTSVLVPCACSFVDFIPFYILPCCPPLCFPATACLGEQTAKKSVVQ